MRRQAVGAVLIALLAGVAIMFLPAPARASCSADYCLSFYVSTDSSGTYTLEIPPGFIGGTVLKGLGDCEWEAKADFGDGSPQAQYTFSAEAGLTASHTFPPYGTYLVQIDAINGHHTASKGELCPSIHIEATVTYSEPASPPPGEPPSEKPTGGPSGGSQGGHGPSVSPNVEVGGGDQQQTRAGQPFWRRCGGGLLTHRVACSRGRRVVAGWLVHKRRGRPHARVAGFSCRQRPRAKRPVACRRGGRRILAPPAI
jgi:hypothetical protein